MTIAIGLLWAGYCLGYYGWDRITGGNDKFVSLVWPGKYTPTTRDDGSGGATTQTTGPAGIRSLP